jgi:hypothetical protein
VSIKVKLFCFPLHSFILFQPGQTEATMQLLKIAALQACIALAFAMPQSLEKRGNVGVYFCQDYPWAGTCQHQFGPVGQCSKISTFDILRLANAPFPRRSQRCPSEQN